MIFGTEFDLNLLVIKHIFLILEGDDVYKLFFRVVRLAVGKIIDKSSRSKNGTANITIFNTA